MISRIKGTVSLAVLLLLAVSSTPTHCFRVKNILPLPDSKYILMPAALATVATAFIFFSREPGKYELRFDKEAFQAAWENKEYKEVLKESLNYLSDLLGCRGKGSSVKVIRDGEKVSLDVREGADAIGLGGTVHQYFKPAMQAIGFFVALKKFESLVTTGWDELRDFAAWPNDISLDL